jgi:phage baseplate assembly protein gpV
MSSALLFDGIARIARHEAAARSIASVGVVTSIFAHDGTSPDHAVSIKLRESGLVLPRVPIAVGAFGMAAIPSVGELVLVTFLEGDHNAPVVIGRLYHPDQNPPRHDEQQIVLRLPSGSDEPDLNCEIDSDPVKVTLTMPGDVSLEIKEDTVTVAIGEIKLQLDAAGGGRLFAEAASTSITLKKDGDIAISSQQGKITLDGMEIDITAQGKVKISGATVELN